MAPLQYLGKKCAVWNPQTKPIMDMMEELSPNILFVMPNECGVILKDIKKDYNFILVYVGFGECCVPPDVWLIPENTSDEVRSKLINPLVLRKCANLAKLGKFKESKEYNYDLTYISDTNIYQNEHVKETIIMLSLLNLSFAIVGENKIPLPQYLGNITLANKAKLIKSCEIGLDFNLTNAFNYAIYRKPCICECGAQIIPKLQYYFKDEENRKRDGENAYQFVIKEDRIDFSETANFLQYIGYKELAQQCQTAQSNLLAS